MITEEEEPKEEFAATGPEFGANPDVYVIPEEAFPEDKEPVITEEEARKFYHSVPPGTDAVVDRQMGRYFEQQKLKQDTKDYVHQSRLHLEPKYYRDHINQPQFEGLKSTSLAPDDDLKRQLNRVELEQMLKRKVTNDNLDAVRTEMGRRMYGVEQMSDRQWWEARTKDYEGQKEELLANRDLRSMAEQDLLQGKPVQAGDLMKRHQSKYPELYTRDTASKFYTLSRKTALELEQAKGGVTSRVSKLAQMTLPILQQKFGPGVVEQAFNQLPDVVANTLWTTEMIGRSVEAGVKWAQGDDLVPPMEQAFASLYGSLSKEEKEQYAGIIQSGKEGGLIKPEEGENFVDTLGKMLFRMGPEMSVDDQIREREQALSVERRKLLSPEFKKYVDAEGNITFPKEGPQPVVSTYSYTTGTKEVPAPKGELSAPTGDQVQARVTEIDSQRMSLRSLQEARAMFQQSGVDVYKHYLPEGLHRFEDMVYNVGETMLPGVVSVVPYVGRPVSQAWFWKFLVNAEYKRIMLQNPRLDPEVANVEAVVVGTINSWFETISVNKFFGRPGAFLELFKKDIELGGWFRTFIRNKLVGTAEQNLIEAGQDALSDGVNYFMSGMRGDMEPQDWRKVLADYGWGRLDTAMGLAPFVGLSAGGLTIHQMRHPMRDLFNMTTLTENGFDKKTAKSLIRAYIEDPDRATQEFRNEIGLRKPENIAKGWQLRQENLTKAGEVTAPLDFDVEDRPLEDGTSNWHVVTPDGKSVFDTPDYSTALAEMTHRTNQLELERYLEQFVAEQQKVAAQKQAEMEAGIELLPEGSKKTTTGIVVGFKPAATVTPEGAQVAKSASEAMTTAWGKPVEVTVQEAQAPKTKQEEQMMGAVSALEEKLGIKVVWVASSDPTNNPLPPAFYAPGVKNTIAVNIHADRNLVSLIGHEWSHDLKRTSPVLYKQIMERMKPLVKDWMGAAGQLQKEYKERENFILSISESEEELTGNVIGDAFGDPDFWAHVAAKDRSLFDTLVKAVTDFLERIIPTKGGTFGTEEIITDVEAIRDLVYDAMTLGEEMALEAEQEAAGEPTGDIRFALPGVSRISNVVGGGIQAAARSGAQAQDEQRVRSEAQKAGELYAREYSGRTEQALPGDGGTGQDRPDIRALLLKEGKVLPTDPRITEHFPDVPTDSMGYPILPKDPNTPPYLLIPTEEKSVMEVDQTLGDLLGLRPGLYHRQNEIWPAIINKILRDVEPSNLGRKAFLSAGGPASGKGSLMSEREGMTDDVKKQYAVIDPDIIRGYLTEYRVLTDVYHDTRGASVTDREAMDIFRLARDDATSRGLPVYIDSVMSRREAAQEMHDFLVAKGYQHEDIQLAVVVLDPFEAAIRSFIRGKYTGRYTGLEYLFAAHGRVVGEMLPQGVYQEIYHDPHIHDNNNSPEDQARMLNVSRNATERSGGKPGPYGGVQLAARPAPRRGGDEYVSWWKQSKASYPDGSPRDLVHFTFLENALFNDEELGYFMGSPVEASYRMVDLINRIDRSRPQMTGQDVLHDAKLMRGWVSLQNPLRLPDMVRWEPGVVMQKLKDLGIMSKKEVKAAGKKGATVVRAMGYPIIRQAIEDAGYDGIVFRPRSGLDEDAFIAFHPEQVRALSNEEADYGLPQVQLAARRGEMPTGMRMTIDRQVREVGKKAYYTDAERDRIEAAILDLPPEAQTEFGPSVREQVERHVLAKRIEFPDANVNDPWGPAEVTGVKLEFVPGKPGEPGRYKAVTKWGAQPFSFDRAPEGTSREEWVRTLAQRSVADILEKLRESRNADVILRQLEWYRMFVPKLRREFGGFSDLFADLLGSFSPQNNVAKNWRDAVVMTYMLTQGNYDELLGRVDAFVQAGGTVDQWVNEGRGQIRKVDGSLFGANSRHGMKAALELWREIKKGDAAKARNFTLNIIDAWLRATIDRWAGRHLQRMAGMPRIPLMAEADVPGEHRTAGEFGDISSTFGFGQDVFDEVARILNESGDPRFVNVAGRDVQALTWFIEKEIWGERDWTPEESEGGSLEEMLAKQMINRFRIGLSQQISHRRGAKTFIPNTAENVAFANDVWDDLRQVDDLIASRVIDSMGMFMFGIERSLDLEALVGPNAEPNELIRIAGKHGGMKRQQNVHLSRVILDDDEVNPNARPGMEIFFDHQVDATGPEMQAVMQALVAQGIDGFTMIADPRSKVSPLPDRPGKVWGIHWQYVPEYAGDLHWHENATDMDNLMVDSIRTIAAMPGVAHISTLRYDTLVLTRGIDYDKQGILASALSGREAALWRKRYLDANAYVANRELKEEGARPYEPYPYRSKARPKPKGGVRGRKGTEAKRVTEPVLQLAARGGKPGRPSVESIISRYYEEPVSRIAMLTHIRQKLKETQAKSKEAIAEMTAEVMPEPEGAPAPVDIMVSDGGIFHSDTVTPTPSLLREIKAEETIFAQLIKCLS